MTTTASQTAPGKADSEARVSPGRFLTFNLAGECYGLEILKVQEIIGILTVTRVPRTPAYVRGVINLRGKVIPVIDLRAKLGFDSKSDNERTCIIVLHFQNGDRDVTMGVIVDSVSEVLNVSAEQLEPTPEFGASVSHEFILGLAKLDKNVVILLDADRILSTGEIAALKPSAAA